MVGDDYLLNGAPNISSWSYDSGHLPASYHQEVATFAGVLDWLRDDPHLLPDGSFAGYSAAELIILAVGLIL